MTTLHRAAALLLVLVGTSIAAEPKPLDVFVSGQGGYHTYRIPALLVGKKGTLLAFCEGRKSGRGDHGDIDMVLRRSTDGGATWLPTQIVYEEGGDKKITIGNPCPVVDQDSGRIWLPFTRDNKDVLVAYSDDEGATWSAPKVVTADVKKPDWDWYATGPGVGIQLTRGPHKGRLVIPCDHGETRDGKKMKLSHVFFSDDRGATWKLGGTVAPHTNECQVVEAADGSLIINMRNQNVREGGPKELGGMRAVAASKDGGATWSEVVYDKTLIEPVCQAGFLRVTWGGGPDRNIILFCNPATTKDRTRMTVRLSYDEGKTWPVSKLLYEGSAAYSCPAVLPDGSIGILYERDGYKTITFARLTMDRLTKPD